MRPFYGYFLVLSAKITKVPLTRPLKIYILPVICAERGISIVGAEGTKMRKVVFGISLFIALVTAGCASTQLHQSLLLHEHRQLEDALFVAQAHVADLERENDLLRKQRTSESFESPEQSRSGLWDDLDFVQPLEMPKMILPGGTGTTEMPDALRGSQMFPIWTPRR